MLIMQCLEKKREDRPESAKEIARRLDALSVPRWSEDDAYEWWSTVGPNIVRMRGQEVGVGSLATIQAGPMETDT